MFSLLQVSNSSLVMAQAATGDSSSVVGWLIVLVLLAIFAGFVISIFRTKPIDLSSVEVADGAASTQATSTDTKGSMDLSAETKVASENVAATSKETRAIASEAVGPKVPAAPKVKGLKGKKKQQKKKINAQRGAAPTASSSSPSAKAPETTTYQPRVADYIPNVVASGSVEGQQTEASSADAAGEATPAVEPVRLASTYAINAMANKPRSTSKSKDTSEKKSQPKNAVQGFHKMDKYREPIRTVDAPIATTVAPRVDLQSASIGGEPQPVRKEERRERRPRREAPKPVQTEAENPRTLKDFLAKKPDEE